MDHENHPLGDAEFEALLRDARPAPSPTFVAATERRLLPERRRAPAWRIGAAVSGGLAALLLTLSLAGGGPLGGDGTVDAKDDCRDVAVQRDVRMPRLRILADGTPEITYRTRSVERVERRCR